MISFFRFPVGRWLDKDEDDGKISLDLEPNKKPASKATAGEKNSIKLFRKCIIFLFSEPPKPAVDPNKSEKKILCRTNRSIDVSILDTPYVVTVQTGSVSGAGTDAKVFISLNGDKNKITKYQLQKTRRWCQCFRKRKQRRF